MNNSLPVLLREDELMMKFETMSIRDVPHGGAVPKKKKAVSRFDYLTSRKVVHNLSDDFTVGGLPGEFLH